MEITVEQLEKSDWDGCVIADMRSETEKMYGAIPGSVSVSADNMAEELAEHGGKKIIVVCARGQFSVGAAEGLREKGFDVPEGIYKIEEVRAAVEAIVGKGGRHA